MTVMGPATSTSASTGFEIPNYTCGFGTPSPSPNVHAQVQLQICSCTGSGCSSYLLLTYLTHKTHNLLEMLLVEEVLVGLTDQ